MQAGGELPAADVHDELVATPHGEIPARVIRPEGVEGALSVVLYVHGAGWVFGSPDTHERLARELATGARAVVVLPHYDRSPDVRYPVALEQSYAVARWAVAQGADAGFDGSRLAAAGDSVGGNLTAAITLLAKERGDLEIAAQLLFYPVTDAAFETGSCHRFATGYFLHRAGMQWFWDQYTTDEADRGKITVSPLRASVDQLRGLPKALVITAEADVLCDEGGAYPAKLRDAGVDVTATRKLGITHDFVMLDALRETHAASSAIAEAIAFLDGALSG